MLVLSRKVEQQIQIDANIVVTVISVSGNRVKLGIEAPNDVQILRKELKPYGTEQWTGFDADITGEELPVFENASISG